MSELSLGGGHLQYSPQAVLGSGSETRPLVVRVGSQHPTLQQVGQDLPGEELSHIWNRQDGLETESVGSLPGASNNLRGETGDVLLDVLQGLEELVEAHVLVGRGEDLLVVLLPLL